MRALVLNLFLAIVWVSLTGRVTAGGLAFGFLLGYLLLLWLRRLIGPTTYFEKVPGVLSFLLFYAKEMVRANLRVARDVISIRRKSRPGIVAVPLDLKTDLEITVLASLIALTPGTFGLDISSDRRVLFVHAMFVDSPDALRVSIKNDLERRVKELFR
ncbi:Na+/H+ antiporter subunit E [Polyangium spumosum]|uniref:Na+/H+ antiporter subunit E n=1 Tax=Polyangium spumosum TaxID=889282 RepID=A0A6N7PPM5_9BACT|nr:Na+/H+ antiporter subunit E [Polyangium spumosum]MRG92145.1 Na+/H+ antiporter subunit E [Polyangium spumosum]